MNKKLPLYKNKRILTSFFGIFIISIMVFSVLNVYQSRDKTKEIEYNGYKFYENNGYWVTNINGQQLTFRYNPLELSNISLLNYNVYDKIYLSYNPKHFDEERFVLGESLSLFKYVNIKPILSCYEEKDCPDIPLVDCDNYNSILLKYNENKTNIYIENKCLILEGSTEEQIKYVYKITYNLLGI